MQKEVRMEAEFGVKDRGKERDHHPRIASSLQQLEKERKLILLLSFQDEHRL